YECAHEFVERQAGSIIEDVLTKAIDAFFPLQMALLADIFPKRRRQEAWVDNGFIFPGFSSFLGIAPPLDVQLARTVPELTADPIASEHRFAVAILRARNRLNLIRMAVQTFCSYRPFIREINLETGRQVPGWLLRKPTNWGLEEITIAIDNIGTA